MTVWIDLYPKNLLLDGCGLELFPFHNSSIQIAPRQCLTEMMSNENEVMCPLNKWEMRSWTLISGYIEKNGHQSFHDFEVLSLIPFPSGITWTTKIKANIV